MKKNLTTKIVSLVLLVVIVVLLVWVYKLIEKPVKFENDTNKREQVVIRVMEEEVIPLVRAYRDVHGKFTTDWDVLTEFALHSDIEFRSAIYDENNLDNKAKIDSLKKIDPNWKNERVEVYKVRDVVFDVNGQDRVLSDEHIKNIRYIPFSNKREFQLMTTTYESGSYKTELIRGHAPYVHFLDIEHYNQEVWNLLNDKFTLFVNNSEASEDMKKMKSEGLKKAIERVPVIDEKTGEYVLNPDGTKKMAPRHTIGVAVPIDFDIEYFGLTFGSLETPTSEAGNWSGGVQ